MDKTGFPSINRTFCVELETQSTGIRGSFGGMSKRIIYIDRDEFGGVKQAVFKIGKELYGYRRSVLDSDTVDAVARARPLLQAVGYRDVNKPGILKEGFNRLNTQYSTSWIQMDENQIPREIRDAIKQP